jgi:hypothetical protein
VAKQFKVLRADLSKHFDEIGEDATAQREAIEQGMRDLLKDIERAFSAATATVRDPVVRKDIVAILEALRGEITTAIDSAMTRRPVRRPASKTAHKSTSRATAHRPVRHTAHH